jgi:hypothetical protein
MLGTKYDVSFVESTCSEVPVIAQIQHRTILLHVLHQLDTITTPGSTYSSIKRSQVHNFLFLRWILTCAIRYHYYPAIRTNSTEGVRVAIARFLDTTRLCGITVILLILSR